MHWHADGPPETYEATCIPFKDEAALRAYTRGRVCEWHGMPTCGICLRMEGECDFGSCHQPATGRSKGGRRCCDDCRKTLHYLGQ